MPPAELRRNTAGVLAPLRRRAPDKRRLRRTRGAERRFQSCERDGLTISGPNPKTSVTSCVLALLALATPSVAA